VTSSKLTLLYLIECFKTLQIVERGSPLKARFTENLKPGRTYQVVVKTVSGSVASWPATGNVTTRPLPVLDNIQTLIGVY
jgi:hypothetical protein